MYEVGRLMQRGQRGTEEWGLEETKGRTGVGHSDRIAPRRGKRQILRRALHTTCVLALDDPFV